MFADDTNAFLLHNSLETLFYIMNTELARSQTWANPGIAWVAQKIFPGCPAGLINWIRVGAYNEYSYVVPQ